MTEENRKTTDRGIAYLREIGVEKIKEDTHLDSIKIADILEKRFDKLDDVRAKGFIHILEKEYHLDLSEWLEEYYLAYPQIEDEEQEKREIYTHRVKRKKIVFYFSILLVCVLLGLIAQMVLRMDFASAEIREETISQSKESPQDSLIEASDEVVKQATAPQEEPSEQSPKDDAPIIQSIYEIGTSVFGEVAFDPDQVLYLEFLKPVWVGVVYLDTKKRTAKINQEFDVALDKELLIYIAYGNFVATLGDDEKKFNTYKPIFLIYTKEGGLRQIVKEEFVALNGGIEW